MANGEVQDATCQRPAGRHSWWKLKRSSLEWANTITPGPIVHTGREGGLDHGFTHVCAPSFTNKTGPDADGAGLPGSLDYHGNTMSWRDYWNSDTPIYVNARHKQVHYRRIADDIERLLMEPSPRVLDYGCGEALAADRVAKRCEHLYLCDGAELVRGRLSDRFGDVANITILAPEDLGAIADGSLDVIVVNSVVQYLNREELTRTLAQWRRKLAPGGRLVVADVIPHKVSPVTDAMALLASAAQNGFLFAAVLGLGKTFFSDYRRVRSALGLAHYDEAEMLTLLRTSGFAAERVGWNFGHNQARMAFSGTPTADAAPAA